LRKLRLLAVLLSMMAVVSMSTASPVMAYPEDSPYDDRYSPYDDYPPYYDDAYGAAWYVDEVTDADCDEDTGTCEYEVVGEFAGYPAEFELVCDGEGYSPYAEGYSPYDEGYSPYDAESCEPTDVELL